MTIAPMPHDDPIAAADQAASELATLTGAPTHDIALVLGSGWLPAVDLLGETLAEFPSTDLHGFAPPAVAAEAETASVSAKITETTVVFRNRFAIESSFA